MALHIFLIRNVLACCLLLTIAHTAMALERLGWEDLAPVWEEPEDPLKTLTTEQRDGLLDLYWMRNVREYGTVTDELNAEEEVARADLAAKGVDVDTLLAKLDALREQIEAQDATLVKELDGREVQIPGYALPLEFSGTLMTEFLLVPYVGACIHSPPPPANQIVHVQSAEGIESQGLYTPVWVTGQISTTSTSQSLSFVDGASDISVGYGMKASRIELYEE